MNMADSFISKKNILILSIMITVFGSLACFGIFYTAITADKNYRKKEIDQKPRLFEFKPMVISLVGKNEMGQSEVSGHLKIRVAVEVLDKNTEDFLKNNNALYVDIINNLLTGKKISEVYDEIPDSFESKKNTLRNEILSALNESLKGKRILSVKFSDYFVQ